MSYKNKHFTFALFVSLCVFYSVNATAKFDELFQPYWASDHFSYNGDAVDMKLDNYSGK